MTEEELKAVIKFLEREKDIALDDGEGPEDIEHATFIGHLDYLLGIAKDPNSNG